MTRSKPRSESFMRSWDSTRRTSRQYSLVSCASRAGKRVSAWALQGDLDVQSVRSNTFTMEWPSGSGVMREFPEVDRAEWFGLEAARRKLLPGQVGFLDRLSEIL